MMDLILCVSHGLLETLASVMIRLIGVEVGQVYGSPASQNMLCLLGQGSASKDSEGARSMDQLGESFE